MQTDAAGLRSVGRRRTTREATTAPALIVRTGPSSGLQIEINSPVVIGREGADVVIADNEMSGRHAQVEPVGDGIGIRDLDSTNGTYVNNVRIEAPTLLNPGNAVRLGQTWFEVVSDAGGRPPAQQHGYTDPSHQMPPQQYAGPPQGAPPPHFGGPQAGPPMQAQPPEPQVKQGPGGLMWQELRGRRAVVHTPVGSFASYAAATEIEQADRIFDVLMTILEIPEARAGAPVDVYLVDPPVGPPGAAGQQEAAPPPRLQGVGESGIVRVVTNEAFPAPLATPLAQLLLTRWFGEKAASLPVIVEGLAGMAAGQAGWGPPPDEAHAWVQAELAEKRKVSVMPRGPRATGGGTINRHAATSFVSFLIESSEPGDLQRFLTAFDPDRPDEAAMGIYEQSLAEMEEGWHEAMQGMGSNLTVRSALSFLTPLLKPHAGRYLEVLLYMLFGVALANLLPVMFGCITDALAAGGDNAGAGGVCGVVGDELTSGRMLLILLVLVVLYIVEAGLQLRRAYVTGGVFSRIGAGLQERMFAHLQRLSHRFFAGARIGDLNSRLTQDLEELEGALESIYSQGAYNFLMLIISAFTILTQNLLVGAIVLVVIPAFVVIQRILGPRLAMTSYDLQEISGDTASLAQENLSAQAVVKALSMEERSVASYRERLRDYVQTSLRLNVITQLFEGSINMTSNFTRLAVIGIGGILILSGNADDPGSLIAILLLIPNLIDSVAQLADVGQVGQAAAASVQRANEIFDEPVEIQERPNAIDLPPLRNEIRLENVTFGYEEDQQILKELNLDFPRGKHTVIVGPSGSGKSTVVNLLMRFWDPDQGRVLFDGVDIRDATLRSLRGQIGLVFQETFVFNLSFRENIRMSRPDATDEEVAEAVRQAQLESFVESLPAGYETVLGERGSRMSGGQRQRLSIARALLRNPPILILDEATSALDARTEAEILDTLEQVVKERTTITITHRLGIAVTADEVVVLEQGRLVERGPHAELVKAGGLYQRLFEEQMGQPATEKSSRVDLEAARLRKIPLFADLDAQTLSDLALQLSPERYPTGETIVRQGDPGDKLYVISEGQADVYVEDGGIEVKVNTLNAGDYLGEYALLTNQPRTATVRANQPTEVFTLSRAAFIALIEQEPELRSKVDSFVNERRSAFEAAAAAAGIT
ncbi:MAG: ATP-binding cassette domain-containing protein [Actinomycetota bacterium]|nr:ATP-binding cassette domain-containing protein [Actinomycetota bacterium]